LGVAQLRPLWCHCCLAASCAGAWVACCCCCCVSLLLAAASGWVTCRLLRPRDAAVADTCVQKAPGEGQLRAQQPAVRTSATAATPQWDRPPAAPGMRAGSSSCGMQRVLSASLARNHCPAPPFDAPAGCPVPGLLLACCCCVSDHQLCGL
jgi:hypothetical protein